MRSAPFNSAFRTPHAAFLLLDERDLEAVGVGDGERPIAPRRLGRLAVERPALRLDLPGDGADVLGGRYPEAEPLALLAVPSLGEVVLTQHDVTRAGLHLQAAQTTVRFPALPRCEAEHVPVPGDALLQVVHGERRGHAAQPQRFGLLARGAGGATGGPGGPLRRGAVGSLLGRPRAAPSPGFHAVTPCCGPQA